MNETEIRDRLHDAFGESSYPSELAHRIGSHLVDPPRANGHPKVFSLVAFVLALAIIGTLVFVRMQSGTTPLPATTAPANPSPQNTHIASGGPIPQADLDQAQVALAADLVTPLNLASTSNGRIVTLIGAYADSARTVLFFRSVPFEGTISASVSDDQGLINASSTAARGSFGDYIYWLDAGPRAGTDGIAHLNVAAGSDVFPTSQASGTGSWTFSFPLKVNGSSPLSPSQPLTALGSWKFTIEALDVTPTVIHFQAVINGAAVEDIAADTVALLDANGQPVTAVTYTAGTTVPKSQIGSTPPRSTRVNVEWPRPGAATDYTLVIKGGGSQYRGALTVPAPVLPKGKKAMPVPPTDYPGSTEGLTFDGAFPASVDYGHPNACGSGTGPSGAVFAFATWFQVDQDWYMIAFATDPRARQYTGPGTYSINASLYPLGGGAIFTGPVTLKVISDRRPGPQTGTVHGTLAWTGASAQPYKVNVSGSWTCTFTDQLGPG